MPSEESIYIGKRIRALRTRQNLTQEQLAGLAGLSAKYLGEVERGEGNISVDKLSKLAAVLGLAINAFLEPEQIPSHAEAVSGIVRLAPLLSEKDAQIAYRMLKLLTNG